MTPESRWRVAERWAWQGAVFGVFALLVGVSAWSFIAHFPSRPATVIAPSAVAHVGARAESGTIVRLSGGTRVRLRSLALRWYDARSRNHARLALDSLLRTPGVLRLDTVPGASHDANGMLVGYLHIGPSVSVNRVMVSLGLVRVVPDRPGTAEDAELRRLVSRAR